ncbi:MAG TPA: cytochrome c oxidase subunit II [Pirellulaceae bacterium]|nr:cytochrome c oxidase subunit II [Pirellulaceae bacterium]
MGRFWSLLFLMVPVLGVGIFVWAIAGWWPIQNHWLPDNINDHGHVIDSLFNFILYLTGAIFIATGLVLFWFLWKYDAAQNAEPVKYSHGSHTLEVVWSIIPSVTLLFIAIYQMNAWADAKLRRPEISRTPGPDGKLHTDDDVVVLQPPLAEVTGRQFEWRVRYAAADGILGTEDDVQITNELHIPQGEDVVLRIKSQDVLHSFFLPNLRIKQDVVPGMKQHVWFRANRTGVYDIVCAELCGWGHYKMRGRLTVEDRSSFNRWLADQHTKQTQAEFQKPTGGEE